MQNSPAFKNISFRQCIFCAAIFSHLIAHRFVQRRLRQDWNDQISSLLLHFVRFRQLYRFCIFPPLCRFYRFWVFVAFPRFCWFSSNCLFWQSCLFGQCFMSWSIFCPSQFRIIWTNWPSPFLCAGKNGKTWKSRGSRWPPTFRFHFAHQRSNCLPLGSQGRGTVDQQLGICASARYRAVSSRIKKVRPKTWLCLLGFDTCLFRNSPKGMIYDNGLHQIAMNYLFTNYKEYHPRPSLSYNNHLFPRWIQKKHDVWYFTCKCWRKIHEFI